LHILIVVFIEGLKANI